MRALDLAPVVLAVALLGWVGVQAKRAPERAPERATDGAVSADSLVEEASRPVSIAPAAAPVQLAGDAAPGQADADASERLHILRRIDVSAQGTYIHDHLADQDSAVVRWSERADGVRVWVQPQSTVPGFHPQYAAAARDAFAEWKAAGFPVAFIFVVDSAAADITIEWIEKFPENVGQQVGYTRRAYDNGFRIRGAEVQIAMRDSAGGMMPPGVVAAVARHEVGHALGLGHSTDAATLMFPSSHSLRITDRDRQTLRLLYMLPPGSLKDGAVRPR